MDGFIVAFLFTLKGIYSQGKCESLKTVKPFIDTSSR